MHVTKERGAAKIGRGSYKLAFLGLFTKFMTSNIFWAKFKVACSDRT